MGKLDVGSYVLDQWHRGPNGVELVNANSGAPIATTSSDGIDFAHVVDHARQIGGPNLRAMSIHQRANALKAIAKYLIDNKEYLYEVSSWTGATRADSWIDIDGGAGTFFSYSSLARRELPDSNLIVEGPVEPLSKHGTFLGRHVLTPKRGVAVHINAYNFPVWGMMEKIAPSIIAGMPVIVKPATVSCFLTYAVVELINQVGAFPSGAVQLVCGSLGDTLDHLNEQDVVTFTGSASTGARLKAHPNVIAQSIPFNMEADSLNCSILGASVAEEDPEFDRFIAEVINEITVKAGQKCTAIRRVIVPEARVDAVIARLRDELKMRLPGNAEDADTRMGPLVGRAQMADVWQAFASLRSDAEVVIGGDENFAVSSGDKAAGAYFPASVLRCDQPLTSKTVHEVEAFGPVTTLMPYQTIDDAIEIARLGKGSLVGSVFTHDITEAREIVIGAAAYHGRMLINDRDSANESTGHGSPLPNLIHGGPGRAGGGEELGGLRAVKHYMQRTALQGSPSMLTGVTEEYHRGSAVTHDDVHPFRKYFEDLTVGAQLVTHRRTVTEADIVNFGCVSGDHFYAHFDEIAAADSLFEKRVAHGYFVISAAAGMFVDPGAGPVLANYGLDNLRFIEPVGIGDTIQVKLTVKRKIRKDKRPDDKKATGVVIWDVEVVNQDDVVVALYDILTLVQRKTP